MSSLDSIPLSEMIIFVESDFSSMFLVVLRSIFNVSRLRLLIPTISALVLHAFSNSSDVCASTTTFTPFLCP